MTKSLADLRANPPKSRPERSITLCLVPHLVAEVQRLTAELGDIPRANDGEESARPRRQGEGLDPRAAQINDQLADLLDQMAEHEGQMRLRAVRTDGEWRNWCNQHPSRGEDEPGYDRDQRVTRGYCNADALLDDLSTYAVSWNDDPLTGTDFADLFEPNIATADKAEMALAVVSMYESRLDFQQWRSNLSASLTRSNGSSLPIPSESPTDASTDGSLEPSSEATTSTATESG